MNLVDVLEEATRDCRCGKTFSRHPRRGMKNWARQKFCSLPCYHASLVGVPRDPGARANIGAGRTGKKRAPFSHEWRANMGAAHKGKTLGASNGMWRGGITPENKRLRDSPEYREWRTSVFEKDDYTCQGCGVRGGYLEADHILQFAAHPEVRFDINNGRTMCGPCHIDTPTWGKNVRPRVAAVAL